jgi:hypothetical protein
MLLIFQISKLRLLASRLQWRQHLGGNSRPLAWGQVPQNGAIGTCCRSEPPVLQFADINGSISHPAACSAACLSHTPVDQDSGGDQKYKKRAEQEKPAPVLSWVPEYPNNVSPVEVRDQRDTCVPKGASKSDRTQERGGVILV